MDNLFRDYLYYHHLGGGSDRANLSRFRVNIAPIREVHMTRGNIFLPSLLYSRQTFVASALEVGRPRCDPKAAAGLFDIWRLVMERVHHANIKTLGTLTA